MCKYCEKRGNNLKIKDIDDDKKDSMRIARFLKRQALLYVELEGINNDGFKPCDFFEINYCPMCGEKLDILK